MLSKSSMGGNAEPNEPEEFVSLILANQLRIHNFIRSLVSSRQDAEDLYQKTSMVLWRKFDQYEPGTNFASWAMRVAYFEVCDYRKKMARARVTFSQEVFDALADKVAEVSEQADERREALEHCINGLSDSHKDLIRMRYLQDKTVEEVALQIDRPVKTVYRILQQVRSWLQNCIETRMSRDTGL